MELHLESPSPLQLPGAVMELLKHALAGDNLFILLFVLSFLLHSYANKSVYMTAGLVGAVGFISLNLTDIYKKYSNYCANKALIGEDGNLTVFPDKSAALLESRLRKINVFKKSNCNLNNYFWSVKTNQGQYFYTDQNDTQETLKNILKTTMISELRSCLVDDFFEHCLISLFAREDVRLMSDLSKGSRVQIARDVHMVTDDFFKMKNRSVGRSEADAELDDSVNDSDVVGNGRLTPDVMLEWNEKFIIINAYNGSNEKEIKTKLNLYKNGMKDAEEVYVVASALSVMERIVSQQRDKFVLYRLGMNGELEKLQELRFGAIIFNIETFSNTYRHELECLQLRCTIGSYVRRMTPLSRTASTCRYEHLLFN